MAETKKIALTNKVGFAESFPSIRIEPTKKMLRTWIRIMWIMYYALRVRMVLRGCPFHIASYIANECCSSDQIKRAHQESECQAMPLSRFANLCYYFIIKYTTNASTILLWRLHSRCFRYVANESREKMSTAVFSLLRKKCPHVHRRCLIG